LIRSPKRGYETAISAIRIKTNEVSSRPQTRKERDKTGYQAYLLLQVGTRPSELENSERRGMDRMRIRLMLGAVLLCALAGACGTTEPTSASAVNEKALLDGSGYMGSGDRHGSTTNADTTPSGSSSGVTLGSGS
jgi:hypothetical protein